MYFSSRFVFPTFTPSYFFPYLGGTRTCSVWYKYWNLDNLMYGNKATIGSMDQLKVHYNYTCTFLIDLELFITNWKENLEWFQLGDTRNKQFLQPFFGRPMTVMIWPPVRSAYFASKNRNNYGETVIVNRSVISMFSIIFRVVQTTEYMETY